MKESKSLQNLKKIINKVRPCQTHAISLKGSGVMLTQDVKEHLRANPYWKLKKIGVSFGKTIFENTLVRR